MNYYDVYSSYFPDLNKEKTEVKVCCPFHSDTDPSMSLNLETGEWYCHSCKKGGLVEGFLREVGTHETNYYENLTQIYEKIIVDKPNILKFMLDANGLSMDVIKKYRIGYDNSSNRWTIPFINADGVVIGYKKYAPTNITNKMVQLGNKTSVYPLDMLDKDYLIFTEGEMDALCLISNGFNALTLEPPNNFDVVDTLDINNKPCILCYDTDETGRVNTSKVIKKLYSKTTKIKILDLAPYKDAKDYLNNCGKEKFTTLIEETCFYEPKSTYEYMPLPMLLSAEKYGVTYTTDVAIIGKHTNYKLLPKSLVMTCGYDDENTLCSKCPMAVYGGTYSLESIPYTFEEISSIMHTDNRFVSAFMKRMLRIPHKCYAVSFKYNTHVPLATVKVNSIIGSGTTKIEQQECVVMAADNDLQVNRNYLADATFVRSHMDNARLVFLENITPSDQQLRYDISPALLLFNDQNQMSVWDKYIDILDDLEQHTKIAERKIMLMALDLMFHSPLYVKLEDEEYKGYIDMIIIGDTRTGKSKAANGLIKLYQLGTMIGSENASIAGIIGGISMFSNNSYLSWGILPQNDKKLVILDEANSLSSEIIDKLSYIRSTGIAEIVKINTNKTSARVRLCMITNPISGGNLSRNTYGIEEISNFAKSNQDVSRFDYAAVVQANPDQNIIVAKKPLKYDEDSFYNLVRFAWNLSPDKIKYAFSFAELVTFSQREAMQYQCDLPLIERNSFHEKVLRVATAVAVRTFNYIDGNILVEKKHLDFASKFFYELYADRENGYLAYATRKQANLNKVDFAKIKNNLNLILNIIGNEEYTLTWLANRFQDVSVFTERDIDDIAGGSMEGKKIRQTLTAIRCLELVDGRWHKTPQFNVALEQIIVGSR